MKAISTKNKINNFVYLFNLKLAVLINYFFLKKLLTINSTIPLFFILIVNSAITYGQSNVCNASLKVEQERNTRSTPLEGTYYSMIISNSSSFSDTFSLLSLNINSSCRNSDGSSSANNVNIEAAFLDANLKSINEISISAGESIKFFLHITVPRGTATNKWCCTQIIAESKTCSNYKVNTILHTLIIDSNDD